MRGECSQEVGAREGGAGGGCQPGKRWDGGRRAEEGSEGVVAGKCFRDNDTTGGAGAAEDKDVHFVWSLRTKLPC